MNRFRYGPGCPSVLPELVTATKATRAPAPVSELAQPHHRSLLALPHRLHRPPSRIAAPLSVSSLLLALIARLSSLPSFIVHTARSP